jgi:hypothetical protein
LASLPPGLWLNAYDKRGKLAQAMRNYLVELLPSGPSEALRASYEEWPSTLGGDFPLQITEIHQGSGINRRKANMSSEMQFNVFWHELAVPDPGDERDGQQRAKDIALDLFDEFTALLGESGFRERVSEYAFDPWTIGPLIGPAGGRFQYQGADVYSLTAVLRVTL